MDTKQSTVYIWSIFNFTKENQGADSSASGTHHSSTTLHSSDDEIAVGLSVSKKTTGKQARSKASAGTVSKKAKKAVSDDDDSSMAL